MKNRRLVLRIFILGVMATGGLARSGVAAPDRSGVLIDGTITCPRHRPMHDVVLLGFPEPVEVDTSGHYSVYVPIGWSGTVVPEREYVWFKPAARYYDKLYWDQWKEDYTGRVPGPVSIDAIQAYGADGRPDTPWLSLLVTVEGLIYVLPGTYSDGGGYLMGSDGGINFYYFSTPPELKIGDYVSLEGYVWWDDNGEIYLGYPWTEVLYHEDEPLPTPMAIHDLVHDLEAVGSFVQVAGEVTEKGLLDDGATPYVLLSDDDASIIVYIDADTGANLDDVDIGETWSVMSPAMHFASDIRLSPRSQADLRPVGNQPPRFVGDPDLLLERGVDGVYYDKLIALWPIVDDDDDPDADLTAWIDSDPLVSASYQGATGILTLRFDNATNDGDGRFALPHAVTLNVADDHDATAVRTLAFSNSVGTSLVSLTAHVVGSAVEITWVLTMDVTPDAVRLQAQVGDHEWSVPAALTAPGRYRAVDHDARLAAGGLVVYRLEIVGHDGEVVGAGTASVEMPLPSTGARIVAVRPNPFNPNTTIEFAVTRPQSVAIAVYDMAGRRLRTLCDAHYPSGAHAVSWDGQNQDGRAAASGSYVVVLSAQDGVSCERIMLLK